MYIVSCDRMRSIEQKAMSYGILSSRLMENAGSAAARVIRSDFDVAKKCCVVVCGRGNNGGDGFVIARKLLEQNALVKVILTDGTPKSSEANEMFERVISMRQIVIDANQAERCREAIMMADIIVDAIYGTGFHGEITGSATIDIVEAINASHAVVYAVDMPSGCNADTGKAGSHCVNADCTVTFAFPKTGQFLFPAANHCGRVATVQIGIPENTYEFSDKDNELLDYLNVSSMLPVRKKDSNKGSFGKVLCVCGSMGMAGAAYLCAMGALRSGAGLVQLAVPDSVYLPVASKLDECMVYPQKSTADGSIAISALDDILSLAKSATAVVIGCGLSRNEETAALIRQLTEKIECPVILDADGINAFEGHINLLREISKKIILTPHPGEMSRLCGKTIPDIQNDRLDTALNFSKEFGVTLVLKGADTIIASKSGKAYVNPTGNPGMARGGSGDILAGMTAAFAAQGLDPDKAACCAAFIHGAAGDKAAKKLSQYGMIPTDMLKEIPGIFLAMSR